ncbi:MAG: hypothetical protein GX804_06160 [Lentisphaerae bacterium]|nr:hypothetical protein [Lentisphaerota bacterium]
MSLKKKNNNNNHVWKFHRFGGVDQVILHDAEDLMKLHELDLKLWMALSMPVAGLQLDPKTMEMLDTDNNGRIHPEEILEAVQWSCEAVTDPAILLESLNEVPISNIKDPKLAASAQHVLRNLGKNDSDTISLSDVADRVKIFSQTLFNGDGVVPPEAAEEDKEAEAFIHDMVATLGGVEDRCGRPGVDSEMLERFFTDAAAVIDWKEKAADPAMSPLGTDATASALSSVQAVKQKIDDFFARCRLASFDERSTAILNRDAEDFRTIATTEFDADHPDIAAFPLAQISADGDLPLTKGINPAWRNAMAAFVENAVVPLCDSEKTFLEEEEWVEIQNKLAAFAKHSETKPDSPVIALGMEKLLALTNSDMKERIGQLIAKDLELKPESERIAAVEKLLHFCRDLPEILTNYVNFADFYGQTDAVFQIGTLYIDGRACSLCIEVVDEAKQATLASLSGFFLAYCDLQRPGTPVRKIVAAITDGDDDNLMVGRNGIFIDRKGLVWDATITQIVTAPISVRQAFWLPYKKFVRMIEEQIAKRAQAADDSATSKLTSSVETALTQPAAPAAGAATPDKKLDLGTIALIGTAIGGISALVAGFLKTLFGLGFWLPLGLLGILLLISGPSMLLASLKLRRRNLAPLLDANGWAINTRARVNIPFGATLTKLASLPPGTVPSFDDPFQKKKSPLKRWGTFILLLIILGAILWGQGFFDPYLSDKYKRFKPVAEEEQAEEEEPAVDAEPAEADTPEEAPAEVDLVE